VVAWGSYDSYSIFYSALEDCAARLNGTPSAELGRKVRELVEINRVKMGSFRQLNEFIVVHFYCDQLSDVCETPSLMLTGGTFDKLVMFRCMDQAAFLFRSLSGIYTKQRLSDNRFPRFRIVY
jgi:hypothetical protein